MSSRSNRHRCFGKIRKIFDRTGILLTHDEITYLCEVVLGANNETEFWEKYYEATAGMSKEEEREWLRGIKKKMRKRRAVAEELEKEIIAYA